MGTKKPKPIFVKQKESKAGLRHAELGRYTATDGTKYIIMKNKQRRRVDREVYK